MLDKDIVWVKLSYPDKSVRLFRGTTGIGIIKRILGTLPNVDYFEDDGRLKSTYIFDVENRIFVDSEGLTVEVSRMKPELERKIDKFENCFI